MKMTIRKKLYSGFSAILVLLIIIGIIGFVSSNNISNTYSDLITEEVVTVSNIKDLSIAIEKEETNLNKYLLSGDNTYIEKYENTFADYKETTKELTRLFAEDKKQWQVFQGLNLLQQEFIIIADEMIENKKAGKESKNVKLMTEQAPLVLKFTETANKLISMEEEILNQKIQYATSRKK